MMKIEFGLDLSNFFILAFLSFLLLLFVALDVFYFVRVLANYICLKYFQSEAGVEETTRIHGICLTSDLDIMLNHMNNARFLREADLGRFHFYQKTGLLKYFTNNATVLQGACTIRFRRPIGLFTIYKVTSKITYWDEKNIYFEQRFITGDGFVRAVMLSQQKTVNMNAAEFLAKRHGKDVSYRPEPSEELKLWISSLELSSKSLRTKKEE